MRLFSSFDALKESERLDESMLTKDFNIGFELEGVCLNSFIEKGYDFYLPSYHREEEVASGGAKVLLDFINNTLDLGTGKIERDGSLSTGNADGWTFEYGSPIIPFTIENIGKIKKLLTELKKKGVITNSSCGFHTHISYPTMVTDDIKWILFSIANDRKLAEEITKLEGNEGEISFFTRQYASKEWINELKVDDNKSIKELKLSTDKYRNLRIHPQGTIEWRGPRGFLDDDKSIEYIGLFLKKLFKFIMKIGTIVTSKEYNGFKRDEIVPKLKMQGTVNIPYEEKQKKSFKSLISHLNSDKFEKVIKSLSPKKIIAMDVTTFTVDFCNTLDLVNSLEKIKVLNDSQYIATIIKAREYIEVLADTQLLNLLIAGIKDRTLSKSAVPYYESLLVNVLKNAFTKDTQDYLIVSISEFVISEAIKQIPNLCNKLFKELDVSKTNANKKIRSCAVRLCNAFIENDAATMTMWSFIVKNFGIHFLLKFNKIPVKLQRTLIRKSPYNIQYVNNPDKSIVDYLKNIYGEEIEEYIMD